MKVLLESREAIPVQTAINKIIQHVNLGNEERVDLTEAEGRYLAEDLVADHPVPFFDRVAMDGFALRAQDTQQASFEHPVELKVIDSIGAGHVSDQQVGVGQAIRIMTGAALPSGADAVMMLELVQESTVDGESCIQINRALAPGTHVAQQGEDTAQGTLIAQKGRRIAGGEMAMLATFGYEQVFVYEQPVVGIYATGTELLPVGAPPEPGKIRNSNSYMIDSQLKRLGAIPKHYGILEDDFDLCYQSVQTALQEVDYLITTGGASVGDYDFVPDILHKLNATVLFNKLAMRPGSVTTVAKLGDKWLFGLSGNPSACYTGFELFARPVLRKVLGTSHPHLPRSKAILEHDLPSKKRVDRFLRALIEIKGDKVVVSTVGIDKSGVASSLVEANGLLFVPSGVHALQGDKMEVLWLDRPEEGAIHV